MVFLGPPGAGKGTIAQRIQERYKLPQISTGDLVRARSKEDSAKGKELKKILESGKLVSDQYMADLIKEKIHNAFMTGFILDGYPRTENQAQLLETILAREGRKLNHVVYFEVKEDLIIKRLTARRVCPKCNKIYGLDNPPKEAGLCDDDGSLLFQRNDDNEASVKVRLKEYNEKTAPLIEFYQKKGLLRIVDASDKIENVVQQVVELTKVDEELAQE